jgi:glycerophosphoryl diester phosphodiesterase
VAIVTDAREAGNTSDGFWRTRQRPIVVAHRYGNSLIGARAAECAGADLLEADVWLQRGRLEVRHAKTAGPLPVIWDRWWIARRPSRPFEARDLLDATSAETPIMFDLKGQNRRLPGALLDLLQREQGGRTILVCTQNWRMLTPFHDHPSIEIVHSIGSEKRLAAVWTQLEDDLIDAVSIHSELLSSDVVTRLKSLVTAVVTWPVNTEEQLSRVLSYGVDGFTSDNVELIGQVASSKRTTNLV